MDVFIKMKLQPEQIRHIASLARLGLSEIDIKHYSIQLSEVLDNFEILKQLNTENVEPAQHSTESYNVFREDTVEQSLSQEEVLANAPDREGVCFKVQAILTDLGNP